MDDESTLRTAQRLHPATLLQNVVRTLPALIFILLFQTADADTWISVGMIVLFGVVALPLILLRYLRFRYWITPREIVIQKGIFNRQHRSIPIERIQNIAVEQSLLPRLMGMAKVTLETAGSTSAEGVLEYVGLSTARDIRRVVRRYQREEVGTAQLEEEAEETAPEDEMAGAELLHALSFGRLCLSGLFRFSLLYIAVIFSLLQYENPQEIMDWFRRGQLRPLVEAATASPLWTAFATVVLAALIAWVTGILLNINHYYGFRLWLDDDKLHKRHGLLTVTERTIPLRKVQAVLLRSNPLMRWFGWYRLEVQTMGIDVEEHGHQVLLPFVRIGEAKALAPPLYSLDAPAPMERVSRLTIRRRFVRYSLALAVAVVIGYYFWAPALWGVAAWPGAGVLAYLQYRYHGYALQDDMLYVRRGVFRQHLWVVPVERLQALYSDASLFQRRLTLKTLHPDTAGAATLRYPEIVDLDAGTAERLLEATYAQFRRPATGKQRVN